MKINNLFLNTITKTIFKSSVFTEFKEIEIFLSFLLPRDENVCSISYQSLSKVLFLSVGIPLIRQYRKAAARRWATARLLSAGACQLPGPAVLV